MVMLVIFVLGFFLDFIEIAVVVVPIVAPILLADPSANITAVWLGVMIGLNIQTSFLTPPFGFALFYLRGVAPAIVKTVQMYKGVIPFILLQLFALGIVGYFPALVNYLPNRVSYLSETAPPPKNPKIQYCLEKFVFREVQGDKNITSIALKNALEIDFSVLPKNLKKNAINSIDKGFLAVNILGDIANAEKLVVQASEKYRPKLIKVRRIEKLHRDLKSKIKLLKNEIEITDNNKSLKDSLILKYKMLSLEAKNIISTVPNSWKEDYKTFNQLVKNEKKLQTKYRKLSDKFYSETFKLVEILKGNKKFYSLENKVKDFQNILVSNLNDKSIILNEIKILNRDISSIDDNGKMRSYLKKIKRKIRKKKVNINLILKDYDKFIHIYENKSVWLNNADNKLSVKLLKLLSDTSLTLGARSQKRIPRETGLFLAKCNSGHTDISLSF